MTVHARAQPWTVSGAAVAALLRYARSRGADLADAVARLSLSEAELLLPDTRVPVTAHNQLWDLAAARLDDAELGLNLARRMDLDAFHVVGHLAVTSATVGEALRRIVAHSRLLHDAGRVELERGRGGAWWLFPGCRGLPVPPPRHIAEFSSASTVLLLRQLTGTPAWRPLAVEFTFPRPASVAAHRGVFGLTPTFDAREDRIALGAATLELRIRSLAPTAVGRYLERYAEGLLQRLAPLTDDGVRGRALRVIVSRLEAGGVTLREVSARLATTPRTLQRRLATEGLTFGGLLDEARRVAALRYLEDGVLPLPEIGYLLGFRDPATFHKAFRRWTGVTPGAFRKAARPRAR